MGGLSLNDQRHTGYEVWYLTLTDPGSGWGVWVRATTRGPDEAALWFIAMHPDGRKVARKQAVGKSVVGTLPGALDAGRWAGDVGVGAWDLRWTPAAQGARHVHPLLERARLAKTTLVLPQPAVAVSGAVRVGDERLTLDDVHAGQAHIWGSKHARRWAWCHGGLGGDDYIDAVSVITDRVRRPATPVVARLGGRDLAFTSPLQVLRARSLWALTSWRFETRERGRRLLVDVTAPRETLVGVTYRDPDGEPAWCYNSEVASLRLRLLEDGVLRDERVLDGTAHFEVAQREPIGGLDVLIP